MAVKKTQSRMFCKGCNKRTKHLSYKKAGEQIHDCTICGGKERVADLTRLRGGNTNRPLLTLIPEMEGPA